MHIWQLQEAKPTAMEKYKESPGQNENIVSFLQNSPLYGLDLDLKREKSPMRNENL